MISYAHRGAGEGRLSRGVEDSGCLLCEVDFPIRTFENKTKNTYTYGNVSAWKNKMSIHRISKYCENWPNFASVLRIWHKKYLSGKSGGERKKTPSANPDSYMLDKSICHFRGVGSILSLLFFFRWKSC